MNPSNQLIKNVLVVDDNEQIQQDFRKIFCFDNDEFGIDELEAEFFGTSNKKAEKATFEVSFASQGKEAFQLVQEAAANGTHFGMAFVDMRMPPGWDGVETIEHLWSVDPDLQVVICTAYSDRSWDEISERLGTSDRLLILKKPFDKIEVIQLASSLCEKRRLRNESIARMAHLEEVVVDQGNELKAAHQDAEVLISSITSMLVSLDHDGNVSRWNPVAEKLFGISSAEALGKDFQSLAIRWQSPQKFFDTLTVRSATESQREEFHFTDESHVLRTLDFMICPLLKKPESKARLLLGSDVTIQRALQVQLDQAQRLESVGQLAAGVAHEINTPMQYIGDNVRYVSETIARMAPILECLPVLADPNISDAELIELRKSFPTGLKKSKIAHSLKEIPSALNDSMDGIKSVSNIVAAMKEFSHPGSDQMSNVDINHVVDTTLTVAKNEWKHVAEVSLDLASDLPAISGYASELNQAFLNIIVNAAHAIADHTTDGMGTLEFKTHLVDGFVELQIKDSGGGIPESVQHRIFEPFFTTKEVGKGTGQGLAIAHNVIVQKHQGKIWFEVEEGVGTTFHIQLPLEMAMVAGEEADG